MKKTASRLNKLAALLLMLAMGSFTSGARAESTWITDFSQFNEDDYYEGVNSYWDDGEEYYVLTEPQGGQQGRIFYHQSFNMAIFTADFDIKIGGGTGSDGMTFAWVTDYDYEGGGGGYLDFHNADGFAVEFDTYPNGEYNDPNEEHIGLMEDDVSNHLDSWQTNVGELDCNDWRHVTVTNFLGHIEVTWEDEVVIRYDIEDYQPFDGYFGFSAGTGGGYNWHLVDNVEIVVGGAEMALSRESVEFGPVTSGDRVEQDLTIYNISEEADSEWFSLDYSLSDEGDDPDWLAVDEAAAEGRIAPGDSVVVALFAETEGVELGEYQRTIVVESNDPDHQRIEIPAHIFIVEGFGQLGGMIGDFEDQSPLAGAIVTVETYGWTDTTGEDGIFYFPNTPAWTYRLFITRQDYLPHRTGEIEVGVGDSSAVIVLLRHSEFTADPADFNRRMHPDEILELPLTISNWGNGPLTWALDLVFPPGVEREPWELRQSIAAGDTVNDTRLGGVVFVDGYFYVSGGEHDQNWVYVLDRNGALVRQFAQLGHTNYGYADMDYDGENIWAVTVGNAYCFTTDGDSVTSFGLPFRSTQSLAWDADDSLLWMSEITGNIYAYDRQGQQQGDIRLHNYRIYGLAYWQDDPDGYPLYMFHDVNDTMAVSRANPDNGRVELVSYLYPERGGSPGGAYITNQLDPYSWVFIALANASEDEGGDRIDIWQLYGNTGWVGVEPMEGIVDADADAELTVTLNTAGMLAAQYQVDLAFRHDGVGGADTIPLSLEVVSPDTVQPPPENHPPSAFDLLLPPDSSEIGILLGEDSLFTFIWERSIDPDTSDTVSYNFWLGLCLDGGENTALVDSLMIQISDTSYSALIFRLIMDSLTYGWPDTLIVIRLFWWVDAVSDSDTVGCNQRFDFWIYQFRSGITDDTTRPVSFGIQSAYPNPFNSRLLIDYGLDKPGEAAVSIYDLTGREVAVLASGRQTPGRYRVTWDAAGAPSGVYLVRLTHTSPGLQANRGTPANRGTKMWEQRKVVLIK
jgi:hypothetical protein